MPSLFRRKPAETVTDAEDDGGVTTVAGVPAKGYTPSKRDLGKVTPKRKEGGRRAETPPTSRREAYRRTRAKQRQARAESRAGMMAGKEDYLLPRDKGPERALVRDIVDSRRTVGTWFLGGAFLVLLGSNRAMPVSVQFFSNAMWIFLMLALLADSFLISRKVRRLVRERYPKTTQRMGSLYFYAIMRAISFRRIRVPKPRVNLGDPV